ncbi:unnamed protein product [Caenorhabditis bovis]|uniref:Uncharacterized protein n=1 Tax=Caenorhabditis bovis TaxID=2654633 RepID=A0A8S1F4L0_9PELO|nr:unnamed protein product [Caenorhabditis bovis]
MVNVVTVDTKTGYIETDNDRLVMVILLIFLPPLAVFFKARGCTGKVGLSILLYIFFIFPSYCHAVWFCFIRGREHELLQFAVKMILLKSLFIITIVEAAAFEKFEIGQQTYVQIEAVHLIDTPLGIQIVHAVVPVSPIPINIALISPGVWYIPEQDGFPKLGYLTSSGWFFLNQTEYRQVSRKSTAKKASKNAQLDVTSLLRLAPSSLDGIQFIRKGNIGAYVFNENDVENGKISGKLEENTKSGDAQIIQTGNLAAYIFSEVPQSSTDSLYWLLPAIPPSKTSMPHTTRLHDSSLLLYYEMPRLVRLKS